MMTEAQLEEIMARYIIIPIGLPGSGKTHLYNAAKKVYSPFLLQFCSPDAVREQVYPGYEEGYIPFDEIDQTAMFVTAHRDMEDALLYGDNAYFDATNLTIEARTVVYHRGQAIDYALSYSFNLHYILIYLNIPYKEVLCRNEARGEHRVPDRERLDLWNGFFQTDIKKFRKDPNDMTVHFAHEIPNPERVHACLWNWDEGIGWVDEELCESHDVCESILQASNAH